MNRPEILLNADSSSIALGKDLGFCISNKLLSDAGNCWSQMILRNKVLGKFKNNQKIGLSSC